MELIPINESKIKIMLNESDMKEYNIGDEADCASRETRIAIRNILDRAREQIGFNTEGAEIFVQLYTSKKGGCELFVTKSTLFPAERDTIHTDYPKTSKKRTKRDNSACTSAQSDCLALSLREELSPIGNTGHFKKMIFSFESLKDVCAASKQLLRLKKKYESSAYKGLSDDYYLVIAGLDQSNYSRLDPLSIINEYGKRERSDIFSSYIAERCTEICKCDAIEVLSRL